MIILINKNKLLKIIVAVVIIIAIVSSGLFFMRKDSKTTFSQQANNQLYHQGTKSGSKYVGLICNVDLGWESEYVEGILQSLKKEDVAITFNVTGRWAEKNEKLLLKIKENGHEIGNHGHRHLDYAQLSYEQNLEQIQTSKKIIEDIIKEETKFFQAPSGSFGDNTLKAAGELGYTSIKWDIDTIDWKNREEPDVIIERVKKKEMKENSIILMHPTNATMQAIDDIINIVKENGFKAGRLSDIF